MFDALGLVSHRARVKCSKSPKISRRHSRAQVRASREDERTKNKYVAVSEAQARASPEDERTNGRRRTPEDEFVHGRCRTPDDERAASPSRLTQHSILLVLFPHESSSLVHNLLHLLLVIRILHSEVLMLAIPVQVAVPRNHSA